MQCVGLVLATLSFAMAALVTTNPVAVDSPHFSDYPDTFDPDGCPLGPWKISAALSGPWYIVQQYFATGNPSTDAPLIGVYSGPTSTGPWTRVGGLSALQGSIYSAFYPGTGTTIYIAGTDQVVITPWKLLLQSFDASADAYNAVSVAHPTADLHNTESLVLFVQPNGAQWAFHDLLGPAAGQARVVYDKYATGAWGAQTTIFAPAISNPTVTPMWCGSVDATGVIHGFLGWRQTAGDISDLYYFQVSAVGVVSVPALAYAGQPSASTDPTLIGMHQSAIVGGKLYLPFGRNFSVNGFWQVCALVGDSLVAPNWTVSVIYDPLAIDNPGDAPYGLFLGTANNAALPTVFWGLRSGVAHIAQIFLNTSPDAGTTWSAPVLFYDFTTTPYPGALNFPVARNGYVGAQGAGGDWNLSTCFDLTNNAYTTTFTMASPGTPPTLACPLTNTATQGVFFSATMIATGTAPLSFALLSGPPWLSINSLTGVISGTPTQTGIFSYSVRVTDANGLTATVTCSIGVTLPGTPSGRRPQPITPNTFDGCLGRDFRRYMTIDYGRLGCGRLPDCFRYDEREWGRSTR